MSVIVKGMEMPKGSCEWIGENGSLRRCKLLNGDDDCKMQEEICADATWEEQFAGCPLVEIPTPHGRLIDADKFKADYSMKNDCAECEKELRYSSRSCEYDRIYSKMDFCGWLDDAEVVIEAEGETE